MEKWRMTVKGWFSAGRTLCALFFCLLIGVKCGFSFVLLLEMGTAGNVIT